MKLTIFVLVLASLLLGCTSSTAPKLPYQFATVRLIEHNQADPVDVIARTLAAEEALSSTEAMTFTAAKLAILEAAGYYDMRPSSQMIVDALLIDVGDVVLKSEVGSHLSEAQVIMIRERLQWIRQAAALYGH